MEIRLTAEEIEGLREVARENGLSMAAVVREAVNAFVADYSDEKRRILQ